MNDCNNCGHDIGGCEISAGLSCSSSSALKNFKNHWIPKEKEMEKQKIQFESREQFRVLMQKVIPAEFTNIIFPQFLLECEKCADKYNLIRKSELQTLVDEAEEMLNEHFSCHTERVEDLRMCNQYLSQANNIIKKCRLTIQALKKSHPEYKK